MIVRRARSLRALSTTEKATSFSHELHQLHLFIGRYVDCIERISVVTYDHHTDELKTFSDSHRHHQAKPIQHYQFKLSQSKSLTDIAQHNVGRIIQDLSVLHQVKREHTQKIEQAGYMASYTLPIIYQQKFYGFVFFNARKKHVFTDEVIEQLELLADILTLMIVNNRNTHQMMLAAIKSTLAVSDTHDNETRAHVDRVAHYARLIALRVADRFSLTDEFIEQLFLLAPLHDIGKIAIPDHVLMKPDRLTESEFEVMKLHVAKGAELIDKILSYFDVSSLKEIDMLKNIILYHHERVDGSGYMANLRLDQIPIEARIVAVADVFDALTTVRRYKPAWSNEMAFAELDRIAGTHLDPDCVMALKSALDEIDVLQRLFQDE